MLIIRSHLFNKFPEIVFGFSTKLGLNRNLPYYFNLSLNVGDENESVYQNRKAFFDALGSSADRIVLQKQIHGDKVSRIESLKPSGTSDAMITSLRDTGLAVSSADCAAIFIYDRRRNVIAAVHSGWRGTQKQILRKTLEKLRESFNSKSENLFVYISPSISQKNYEVGIEVAEHFEEKYSIPKGEKFLLDVESANYDMLIDAGIPPEQIQVSNLCTYENHLILHSYRRDGINSGRALGIIAMRQK